MDSTKTLADYIRDKRYLDEMQINEIMAFVGHGCRANTKHRLRRKLELNILLENSGIFSRLHVEPSVRYVCGQAWNEEMRTLRECILGK